MSPRDSGYHPGTQLCIQREIGGAVTVKLETLKGTRRHVLAAGLALVAGLRAMSAAAQAVIPRYTLLRGWGGAGVYRGRWNGGSFGPCYASTPIGMMWTCGQ